ncbi:RsmB/NOP family class I SAM-dependent RNA methyltransferase [Candidatus Bathyarchaeota archaeon]|nr:RsmB/NOP family class I SAM-dependent RNA methyltransferase [Candidatus Bathyarchaeota archaeon]
MTAETNRRLFLDRYRELGRSLTGEESTPQAIRVNTLKTGDAELVETLTGLGVKLRRIPYLDHGYAVEETGFSLGASIEYLLGLYSLQETAAQLPVQALKPKAGDVALDMCAAPGGKTTQMAAYMGNRGVLYAVDVSRERAYALENNLERCSVENCLVYYGDVTELELGVFTKVLLDAPCSGNYVTDGGWFGRRSLGDVMRNAEYQRILLSTAMNRLEPGGTLVYSTCSLEPEENELNVQWLLDNHDVSLMEVEGPGEPALTSVFGERLSDEVSKCRRLWPGEGTQGFFVAKAVKR